MTVLGKFSVVMADPPWDIHMEVHTLFHYSTIVLLFTHSHETSLLATSDIKPHLRHINYSPVSHSPKFVLSNPGG